MENEPLEPSFNFVGLENDVNANFNNCYQYIDECNKFNDAIRVKFDNFNTTIGKSESRENVLKRKIEEEMERNKKREKESINLITELKECYDRNIAKLSNEHEKQITNLFEKHKLEIAKLKSKYEKLKSDKKTETPDASIENNYYKDKFEKANLELVTFQTKIDSLEQELSAIKKEKKSFQEELKDVKSEQAKLKKEITSKDKELSQSKSKIDEFESKLKNKEEIIKEKTKELKAKDKELKDATGKFADLSREHSNSKEERVSNHRAIKNQEEGENPKSDLESQLEKIKRELEKAYIEIDTKKNVCEYLRSEKKEANEKIAKFEEEIFQMRDASKKHLEQIQQYENDIHQNRSVIEEKEKQITSFKTVADEHLAKLDVKQKELNESKRNEKKIQDKFNKLNQDHQELLKEIEDIKRKVAALKMDLDRKNADCKQLLEEKKTLNKTNENLKKVCAELSNQVQTSTKKASHQNSEKKCLLEEKSSIDDERTNLKKQLETVTQEKKRAETEKAQLIVQLYNKDKQHEKLVNALESKYETLYREFELKCDEVHEYSNTIEYLHESNEILTEKLEKATKELQVYIADARYLKEEAAGHITKIDYLEKVNKELQQEYYDLERETQDILQQFGILKQEIDAKEEEMLEKNIRYGETFSQQMKLIEYLKTKADKKIEKKKSLFPFSNSKFFCDNSDQKSDDIQKLWKIEKAKNAELNEQLKLHIQELEKTNKEVSYMKNELAHVKSLLSENKPKSYPTIAHNVPHRYTTTKVKLADTCKSCAKRMYVGTKVKKCQSCDSIVHMDCELVDNCGMPVDMARQVIHDSFDSSNTDSLPLEHYLDSNCEPLPSAPLIHNTESFEKFRSELLESVKSKSPYKDSGATLQQLINNM